MIVANLFAKLGLQTDGASFSKGSKLIGGIKSAIGAFAAFKGVQWFKNMVLETAETADHFNKMAVAVGISSETLQQLEYAAKIGGTNLGVLRGGIQRLTAAAYDASKGVKTQVEAFDDLGLKATKDGKLKQTDALLMEIADKFSTMTDQTERAAVAQKLFGRSGAQLVPFLAAGSAGIEKLKNEFVDLGAQISTEEGAQFEEFNDNMLRMNTAVRGFKNQAVLAILPEIKKMSEGMVQWMKDNKAVIRQRLATIFKGLIFALKMVGKSIAFVVDNWKALAVVFGSIKMASVLMPAIALMKTFGSVSIATAGKAALAWAASMLPFILMVAAIAAVIVILQDLKTFFEGGDSMFGRALDTWLVDLKEFGKEFYEWTSGIRDQWYKLPFIKRPEKTAKEIKLDEEFASLKATQDRQKMERKYGKDLIKPVATDVGSVAQARLQAKADKSAAQTAIDQTWNIYVDAGNADPREIAIEIEKRQRDAMDKMLRQTQAAWGNR